MRIFKRVKEDKGASNTVSFIVIILFVMALLVSFIDVGVYFNVKNEMTAAAENGARNVALYGGTDGALRNARSNGGSIVNAAEDVVRASIHGKYEQAGATPIIQNVNVECGPPKSAAGNKVFCDVTYKYNGIAGNFGFFQLGNNNDMKVTGTAVSEVTIN